MGQASTPHRPHVPCVQTVPLSIASNSKRPRVLLSPPRSLPSPYPRVYLSLALSGVALFYGSGEGLGVRSVRGGVLGSAFGFGVESLAESLELRVVVVASWNAVELKLSSRSRRRRRFHPTDVGHQLAFRRAARVFIVADVPPPLFPTNVGPRVETRIQETRGGRTQPASADNVVALETFCRTVNR